MVIFAVELKFLFLKKLTLLKTVSEKVNTFKNRF